MGNQNSDIFQADAPEMNILAHSPFQGLDADLFHPLLPEVQPQIFQNIDHPHQQQSEDVPQPVIYEQQLPSPEQQIYWLQLTKKQPKKKPSLEMRKVETTTECPICCTTIRKSSKIPDLHCKHVFHKKCLTSWLKKGDKCPLCRDEINC